jgi:hypothetical protein
MIEIPPKFAGQPPVNPNGRRKAKRRETSRHGEARGGSRRMCATSANECEMRPGVETGTQLVIVVRRLLRRPTFPAQRVPQSATIPDLRPAGFATLRSEAVKNLGQAPSRPPVFQGFRGSHSEPVPFFHGPSRKAGLWRCTSESARLSSPSSAGSPAFSNPRAAPSPDRSAVPATPARIGVCVMGSLRR